MATHNIRTTETSRRTRDNETARMAESADRMAFGVTAGSMILGLAAADDAMAHGSPPKVAQHAEEHLHVQPQQADIAAPPVDETSASNALQPIDGVRDGHVEAAAMREDRYPLKSSSDLPHDRGSVSDPAQSYESAASEPDDGVLPAASTTDHSHASGTTTMSDAVDQTVQPVTSMLDAAALHITSVVANVTSSIDSLLQATTDRISGFFDGSTSIAHEGLSQTTNVLSDTLTQISETKLSDAVHIPDISLDRGGVLDQALGPATSTALPNLEGYSDIVSTTHISFIGESLANTIDPHDFGTHGSGSLLHGFV